MALNGSLGRQSCVSQFLQPTQCTAFNASALSIQSIGGLCIVWALAHHLGELEHLPRGAMAEARMVTAAPHSTSRRQHNGRATQPAIVLKLMSYEVA